MDLRFAAFVLITRDATLRTLLVNYADRVECGHAPESAAPTCFLALKWTDNDRPSAPAGSQLLTARVHMPRDRGNEPRFLDHVLTRLQAALARPVRNPVITTRCLDTSPEVMDDGVDTISKSSTFEVAPAPQQTTTGAALLELAPWTGGVDTGTAAFVAPSDAVASMN
jgi:hypothetical protein